VVTYGAIVGCWWLLRVVYTHAADNDSRGAAMSDEGRYITTEIAAERLGVSERSVYRYADYEGGRFLSPLGAVSLARQACSSARHACPA
jgi:hypothetical protein